MSDLDLYFEESCVLKFLGLYKMVMHFIQPFFE